MKSRIRSLRENKIALILTLFVLLAASYSVVLPPFEAPDELFHFAYIQHLTSTGTLPVIRPGEQPMWNQEGGQAPGYYLAAAALTAWIDQSDFPTIYARINPHAAIGFARTPANPNFIVHYLEEGWPWEGSVLALHIARFLSVAMGAVTVWAIYQTLRLLLDERAALFGASFVAFIPQFLFISGAASNDNAITMAAALLLWRLVLLLRDASPGALPRAPEPTREDQSWRSPRVFLLLGLALGLALLSKHAGVTLGGLTFLVLALVAYRARSWRILLHGGALVALVGTLVGGWWYVRNYWLYQDLLAMNMWERNVGRQDALMLPAFLAELRGLEYSFWGLFGWFSVSYPAWVYRLFRALEGLILLGLLVAGVRYYRRYRRGGGTALGREGWKGLAAGMLLLWLLLLTLSWLAFMQISLAAQGRLFFPALTVFALLAAVGARAWRVGERAPRLAWILVAALFLLSAVTPWWILRPAYYPSAPRESLPPAAPVQEVTFGDVLRLEGYELSTEQAAAGESLDLTLFWRVLERMDRDYSIAVKGFGRGGELVARHDSYPDSGRWPTTQMQPGQLIADRITLPIRDNAVMPAAVRLTVDVYQFDSLEMLPATQREGELASPVPFAQIALREAETPPAPSTDYVWRPSNARLALEEGAVQMTFEWEVGQRIEGDFQAFLHLVPAPGAPPVAQEDFEPLEGTMPTSLWWPGDRLPDSVTLQLPADAEEGDYLLLLGLYDLESLQRVESIPGTDAWPVGRLRWAGREWQTAPEVGESTGETAPASQAAAHREGRRSGWIWN